MTTFTVSIESDEYLESCARIRNISRTRLVTMLMGLITKDQMVSAILDDDDQIGVNAKSKGHSVTYARRSQAEIARATQSLNLRPSLSHGTHRQSNTVKKVQLTKNELREQLAQAVVNTGGRRISLVERKQMLIEKIRAAGRLCPIELGLVEEQQRWQNAIRELLEEKVIYKNAPEHGTRRVYYQLRPSAHDPVPTSPTDSGSASSSPDAPSLQRDDSSAPSAIPDEGADALELPNFINASTDQVREFYHKKFG